MPIHNIIQYHTTCPSSQDGHWLACFEVITPPTHPPKSNFFARTKMTFYMDAHPLVKKISGQFFSSSSSSAVLSDMLSRRSRLSRTASDPALKSGKFQAKIALFPFFSGENFVTILSRRHRLSRTTRGPARLFRPRLIDCDKGSEQTAKISRFLPFFTRASPKKGFLSDPLST